MVLMRLGSSSRHIFHLLFNQTSPLGQVLVLGVPFVSLDGEWLFFNGLVLDQIDIYLVDLEELNSFVVVVNAVRHLRLL